MLVRVRPLILLAAIASCSPAHPPPNIEGQTPVLSAEAGAAAARFPTPARWTLFESRAWVPSAQAKIGDGTLLAGEGGERWILRASGDLEGASMVAPESLLGIAMGGAGFRFVGASGALYEAPTPLAPLTRIGDGVKDAIAASIGQRAVLAIDASGDLFRSADGHPWRKIDVTPKDGVFRDVAMHGAVGLLLGAPQRLYFTKDDGVTWKPIAALGTGVKGVSTSETSVVLEGDTVFYEFDPRSESFVATPFAPSPKYERPRRTSITAALDGHTGVAVEEDSDAHTYRIAVFDVGSVPAFKKVDVLDGCFHVQPAVRGRTVMLACDAVGSVDSGIDRTVHGTIYSILHGRSQLPRDGGHATGMITKLFRSEDGGKTFADEATFDGGLTEGGQVGLAMGDGGFVFVGARCVATNVRVCTRARVRPSAQSPWIEMPDDPDGPRHLAFATRAGQPIYSVGVSAGGTSLYKWDAGSASFEVVVSLHGESASHATLDVDDAGVVRGWISTKKSRAFEVHAARVTDIDVPPSTITAAFAGTFGLAADANSGWETIDGGKTWHRVGMPAGTNAIVGCNEEGCITSRGLRHGWEGSGLPSNDTKKQERWAKGLRCRATGSWTALGGGDLPNADDVDHGSQRWLHPTRDLPGAVTLVTNTWSDPPTTIAKIPLMGPAPQPPTYGAATTMHVQPNGVVALRYSYVRARIAPGVYNPVDMQAAWYRPQSGKVFRGAIAKLPSFRVNHDPRHDFLPTSPLGEFPEILWLGNKGLSFRSPAYQENGEWTLYHLRDDGKIAKTKVPELHGDRAYVLDLGAPAIVYDDWGKWVVFNTADQKETVLDVMAGQDDDAAPVAIFDVGGKPSFVATQRGLAPRAWAIPISTTADLAPAIAMPTQLTLGERGCMGAAQSGMDRVILPFVYGSRRPVTIDVDGTKHVLATARATVRVIVGGEACTVAFEAVEPNEKERLRAYEESVHNGDALDAFSALIFPGDPSGALLFRLNMQDWPGVISMRPMACTWESGPLPEELRDMDGLRP